MNRCLQLALPGAGNVAPNPLVGAVLVHEDRIIGEGYHKKYGEAHAEVNCISSVTNEDKDLIQKSTLYVSLEPCVHFGKTPPCTDLIIKNKIPKVVIGCLDVYKEVNGKGIEKLQNAGVEVVTDVLEKECRELNKRFFTYQQKQRPYIILKWAESANGKIGSQKERVFISNEFTNRLVHKWRSEEAAILIGKQTALKDDPALSNRLWSGKDPVRCVNDSDLSLPSTLKIFDHSIPTIVFNSLKDDEERNIKWFKVNNKDVSMIVTAMYGLHLQSVLVEGGSKLLQSFIDEGLWDEIRVIRNEKLVIENGINSPELKGTYLHRQEKCFRDMISYFLPSPG